MRILFVEEVDSTQRVAIEWVLQNRREWDAICADHQTAGRGRRGSQWYDEPGASLLVSLVLWDVPLPEPPGLLGVMAAIATAESLEATFAPLQVQLKYPKRPDGTGAKTGWRAGGDCRLGCRRGYWG
jgi:biotin-(acetyl-CoA carboxylase) ligase